MKKILTCSFFAELRQDTTMLSMARRVHERWQHKDKTPRTIYSAQ